ncbi:hypothetical protein EI969_05710 [Pseudomonas sp. PB101]|jgi:hypothetical protein|uniref:DUF6124 family protein n=1 Tax=Pseudomonas sp. PB101 TaxID=2495428 RepID=UPI0013664292|nr:DUF6124 family protein [Pseudomonas sp. PB101]MVW85449.1 hypothetical protein [Pseudomonas sp. PB101]
MFKVTPNPPDADPVSPHEAALDFHIPSIADIKATPRTPGTLFSVDPQASSETLMVYLVETLASVDVMVHQLVDHLDGGSRNALLGISNSVMLAEITANRVLDQIDP